MNLKKFIKEHGKDVVQFKSYYKYSFCYENDRWAILCGGDPDDIYRSDLRSKMSINELWQEIPIISIEEKRGERKEEE